MYQAARRDGVDPDRLSFTGALRVLRRAIPRAQRTAPKHLPLLPAGCWATSPPSACRPGAPDAIRARSGGR
jgi:hypothetical protein